MKFWVAVTDNDWYRYLAGKKREEVNFWNPSNQGFRAIQKGDLYLFKLKHPHHHIAGGGFFTGHVSLPLSYAWDAFQDKNGCVDYESFRARLFRLKRRPPEERIHDPLIGCAILNQVFYFEREDWIHVGDMFKQSVQRGKTFNTDSPDGQRIWEHVQRVLEKQSGEWVVNEENTPKYREATVSQRMGQGGFRAAVGSAYGFRCSFTGEKTLPVLEAAHIKPYSVSGENVVENGLFLRKDFHALFDRGLITVNPERKIEVSQRIREEWYNGKAYYRLHGKLIQLPGSKEEWPAQDYLRWHNEHVYEKV